MRTVLNEKQLTILKACYNTNPRPDAIMKEQLVELTGLPPRVIRVWFQNKRCKDKKKSLTNRDYVTVRDCFFEISFNKNYTSISKFSF